MVARNNLLTAPPYPVEQALKKLGNNLRLARLRRTQTSKELPKFCSQIGLLCSLGLNGDKFVAELFGLPLELGFQPFFSLRVSGGPDALVVFDLLFNHDVKDDGDLMGGGHGGTFWGPTLFSFGVDNCQGAWGYGGGRRLLNGINGRPGF